ncbi:IS5 family transposase [Xanthomonas theicola]|uniref:IS5 family transposase n=1 Tax=Xanthomonas theicola TaxID=56464 RepID=UPI001B807D58|nr:IS5 family transposase [Xanthomonas theicola]
MARSAQEAGSDRRDQRGGFIARGGQIVDASIVSAPIQRNTPEENAQIKQGQKPQGWSDAKRGQKDVQARWTRKHGKAHYGYKLHANTDRRRGFIGRHEVSAANVHDSRHFETLLDPANTGRTVGADSAYANRAREAELRRQGYRADIQHKGQADQPLSPVQQRRNHRIAKDRALGEHPFARLTQQGGKCRRTIGLARAQVVIGLKVAAHNLMRLARLQSQGIVPA